MDYTLKKLKEKYITFYESEKLKGGLADGKSLEDIARHHKVSVDEIRKEFDIGMKVEMEHTDDEKIAREVASDHLWEDKKYYTKLKNMEKK